MRVINFIKFVPFDDHYSLMGFDTSNIIVNVADVLLFFIFGSIFFISLLVLKKLLNAKKFPRLAKFTTKILESLKFGVFIRLIYESYLIMAISCILNTYAWIYYGASDPLSNIISFSFLALYFPFPFFILGKIWRNRKNLGAEPFNTTYGALFEGLKVEK